MGIRSESGSALRRGDDPLNAGLGYRVLLVEDSSSQRAAYAAFLETAGFEVVAAPDGESALELVDSDSFDAIVLDLFLPGMQGIDVLRAIAAKGLKIPTIAITDHDSANLAVSAMREGALDFVAKPFGADQIKRSILGALDVQPAGTDLDLASDSSLAFHDFVGVSVSMRSVYRLVESAASSKATVFITGESGTGKELCASAIHAESPRAAANFVAINCAAIPTELIESEIFGHVKGAFTGATSARRGAALTADGGTLFLDEVCEMNLEMQAKLLRFVQTGTFNQVGTSEASEVDVRIICATNRDPLEEVKAGRFREDLYYRLHVVPVELPSLRDRVEDVIPLALHFLRQASAEENKSFARFSAEAEKIIQTYSWPGNVRELENAIRNTVILNNGLIVEPEMFPANVRRPAGVSEDSNDIELPLSSLGPANARNAIRPLREIEREAIERAIELCDGSVTEAATHLGISASTLYRKRQSWSDSDS